MRLGHERLTEFRQLAGRVGEIVYAAPPIQGHVLSGEVETSRRPFESYIHPAVREKDAFSAASAMQCGEPLPCAVIAGTDLEALRLSEALL
jgi:hypothetical protein